MSDGAGDSGDFGGITDATAGGNFGGMATSNEGIADYGDYAEGGMSPINWGTLLSEQTPIDWGQMDNYGQTGVPLGVQANPQDMAVDNGFWGKALNLAKGYALSKGLGAVAQATGLPVQGLALAYSGLTAPQGKSDTNMGATLGNLFSGAMGIPGFAMNAVSSFTGNPTLGQSIAAQGGYKGGDAPTAFNGGATNNSANTGNEMGWGSTLGGLAQLYNMYSRTRDNDAYVSSLQNMYGQNSPYAQALSKQLAARDAAAGRRSQYGPRSVELQAALAKAASGAAPSVMQGQQQGFNNVMQMMQQMMALQKMGAFSKLGSLFNSGPELESTTYGAQTPNFGNMFDSYDYSSQNPFGGP